VLRSKRFYFLISFIEGGSVMAAELLGAKMLAPYFGSSLYVWASVLAITLGGLAAGYFAGGLVSYKSKNPLSLFYVLLAAATFTVLMPFSSKFILWAVGMHSLIPSVIISSLCILFPPVFMMGMVSPLIIRSITSEVSESGKAAGAIYAISTLGGIIATFAFGFYVIPQFGLTIPSIITGIVLAAIPLYVLIRKKEIMKSAGFFLLCIWAFSISSVKTSSAVRTVYSAEGLLGQLLVLDYPHYDSAQNIDGYSRWLFVNRISQTMYDSLADESRQQEKYFTYVYRISDFVDSMPKGSKVLLLGLGGGSVANRLIQKGMNVDVCELDKRIAMIAEKYFNLDPRVNVVVDDARHYIKTCDQKYDLIIFDTFKGEDPPNHVFTMESLAETKQLMNPGCSIFVNSLGYIEGSMGKSVRSIYKTFMAAGFDVQVLPTDPDPNQRNMLFYASLQQVKPGPAFMPRDRIDLADAVVLTDEYPVLDHLNAEAARQWRVLAIAAFNSDPQQQVIPVFE
jgi:predicted membrane-bound spermidine synthase